MGNHYMFFNYIVLQIYDVENGYFFCMTFLLIYAIYKCFYTLTIHKFQVIRMQNLLLEYWYNFCLW